MSRYIGPKLRITRRLDALPGLTTKRSKRTNRPGKQKQIGNEMNENKKDNRTEYGIRLEEKQKLKYNYGLTENQLYRYIKEARRRKGISGSILLQLLEMRLDTICFTLGFAKTIVQARQLVNHGHISVNDKVVNIPSFTCHINDKIGIKNKKISRTLIKNNLNANQRTEFPKHVKVSSTNTRAKIIRLSDREDILLNLNELQVIEYYSRR